MSHRQNPTQHSLVEYIDAHNAYVQQLHATNAMLETYHCETVPQLMQELEEIHSDLCSIIGDSIQQGADVICNKVSDYTITHLYIAIYNGILYLNEIPMCRQAASLSFFQFIRDGCTALQWLLFFV